MEKEKYGQQTKCVHAGDYQDRNVGAVTTPIYTSSSYDFGNGPDGTCYPRYLNVPTHTAVAEKITALENGEAGMATASGMAAISTVLFACLKSGDHAIIQQNIYGGTYHLIEAQMPLFGIDFTLVQARSIDDFARAVKPETKLIYFETPTNPLLTVVDIEALTDLAKSRGILTVIDNTFATPINQSPLDLGVDVVIHSATKYLGGHSDLCAGAIVSSEAIMAKVREVAINFGGILGAFECSQLERSIKTLSLRVAQHNSNALALAQFLSEHPRVEKVYYPGLEDHPGHETAKKQMRGFGGMLSVEWGGVQSDVLELIGHLKLFRHAVSLGGVESLICFPALTSHEKMPLEERRELGITDTLLRVSVGIEDPADLIDDMKSALEK